MNTPSKPGPLPLPARMPFAEHLGLVLHANADGLCEWRMDVQAAHCNSRSVAHGGVLMTLLDVAMATAARSGSAAPGAITIEMKTSFLRAAEGSLRASGRLLHHTASLAFCEAELHNARGQLCARASGTFKLMRPAHPHSHPLPAPSTPLPRSD